MTAIGALIDPASRGRKSRRATSDRATTKRRHVWRTILPLPPSGRGEPAERSLFDLLNRWGTAVRGSWVSPSGLPGRALLTTRSRLSRPSSSGPGLPGGFYGPSDPAGSEAFRRRFAPLQIRRRTPLP